MRWIITRKRAYLVIHLIFCRSKISISRAYPFPCDTWYRFDSLTKFNGRFLVFLETRLQAFLCSIIRYCFVYCIALLSASGVKGVSQAYTVLTTYNVGSKTVFADCVWTLTRVAHTIKFYYLILKIQGDAQSHPPNKKSTSYEGSAVSSE